MSAFSSPADLTQSIDAAKAHVISRVIFWPARWKKFSAPPGIRWGWRSVPFEQSSSLLVPDDKHGLYSFVLCPKVASHPKNHFILYVGKADRMTLRARFLSYFQEMAKVKRPTICYILNKYSGYLEFCFTPVQQRNEIERGEDCLLSAILPPFNTDFPAEVSETIRGLR